MNSSIKSNCGRGIIALLLLCTVLLTSCVGEEDVSSSSRVDESQLHAWNEAVEFDGVLYQLESVEFTQGLQGHNRADVNYLTDEADDEGNLTGDSWFMWAKVSMQNTGESTVETNLNDFSLVFVSEKGIVEESDTEGVFVSPVEANNPAESFHYQLDAGERKTVEVGLLLDSAVRPSTEGDLYYCVGYTGSDVSFPEHQFLNVERFWDERH